MSPPHFKPTLTGRPGRPGRHAQQGMVMILSLLFALAVLLLAGSAVRTVVSAERMGGNLRNQSLSFHAAEAALVAAESHLTDTAVLADTIPGVAGTGTGDYAVGSARALTNKGDPGQNNFWRNFVWNATQATAVTVSVNGVNRTAYYVIEALGPPANYGGSTATEAFRVTVFATGGSNEASSLLQATYIR